MIDTFEVVQQVERNLEQHPLSLRELPPVNRVYSPNSIYDVRYAVFGQLDAPNLVVESNPYLTELSAPHYLARLAVHQTALGSDYCVVGTEGYHPSIEFEKSDRQKLQSGDFSPLSTRVLRVLDEIKPESDQRVILHGYSLGADTVVQTAYDSHFNGNRGVVGIDALGAYEPARMADRSAISVLHAFNKSGKNLFKNIVASDLPALLEAWNIDPDNEKAEKQMWSEISKGVLAYIQRGKRNAVAMMRGFGTTESFAQMGELITDSKLPMILGKRTDSFLVPDESVANLESLASLFRNEGFVVAKRGGDHSTDDNPLKSAASVLSTAVQIKTD